MNHTFNKTLIASLLTLSAGGVSASLFQLAEVSTSGLGMAYAGNAAVADNASVVANNPALMTKFKRPEISAGGVLVDTDLTVRGITSNGNQAYAGNVVPTAPIPNMYFVLPVNDDFSFGLGYNVNYGLKTKYPTDFAAGSLGGNTELQAHNFNLSGAYKLGYGFSIGAGLNVVYSKAEFIRHLGDNAEAGAARAKAGAAQARAAAAKANAAGLTAQAQALTAAANQYQALGNLLSSYKRSTEVARVSGNEWSLGWNTGLVYELNENHRWGLAYHSPVDVKFKGHYSNGISAATGNAIVAFPTASQEFPGKLTLNLPAYWELSGFHKLTDRLAVQYSWKRTEWSRLKTLDAYGTKGEHYLHKQEDFSDASRYALGVSYDVSEPLTLRAGIAYDENASTNHPSISIPDTNRMWYSVGATYRVTPALSVDAGYAFLRGTANSFDEKGTAFKIKARGNLYGLNLNYKF
ncbi:outer membrane protein transport protein [Actinobacillus genomosp. 1]|uniref:outer membrane protein transport protein n=1 Tax=Actinobacillus genomosp. 1 TaxID=254839 RepID=UPI00244213C1|nr:outer membrane protein transport protein [Actinobacillus genomosp. 1]WGE36919.1 outer membrane protein transport protein [Actinobacillus genomosp. 1]